MSFCSLPPEPIFPIDFGMEGTVDVTRVDNAKLSRRKQFKLENVFPTPVLLLKNNQFNYEMQIPGLLSRRKSSFVNANERHQVIDAEIANYKQQYPFDYVPEDILKELLLEESYHVSFHDVRKRQNGNTIDHFEYLNKTFIVHVSGPILERFTVSEIERSIDSSNPHVCLKRITSYMVDGTILQISSFKNRYNDKELPLIAILTSNSHIIIFNFKRLEQYWGIIKIEHLKFSSEVYDFVWNQGNDADLLCVTQDEGIFLWQGLIDPYKMRILRKPSNKEDDNIKNDSSETCYPTRKKIFKDPHLRCTFGMNANCLYVSTPNKLTLIDYQNSCATESTLLLISDDMKKKSEDTNQEECEAYLCVEEHETIQAIAGHPTNPFIFVIATEKYLYLLDRRYLNRPLIKWKHHLDTGSKRIPIVNRVKILPDWNVKSGISFVYLWDSTCVEIFQYFHENTFNNKRLKESIHELLTKITEDRTIGVSSTQEGTVDNKRDIYKIGTSYARLIGLPRKITPYKVHALLNTSDDEGFNASLSGVTFITSECEKLVLKSNTNPMDINVDIFVVYSTLNGDIYFQSFIFNAENIKQLSNLSANIKIKKEKKQFIQPSDDVLKEHEVINVHGLFKYMIGKRVHSRRPTKRQKIMDDDELSSELTQELNEEFSSSSVIRKQYSEIEYLRKFENQILKYIEGTPRTVREIHTFLLMNCSIPYTSVSTQSIQEFLNEKCECQAIFEDEAVFSLSLKSRDLYDIPEEERVAYYGQKFQKFLDLKSSTSINKPKRKESKNKQDKITTPNELFNHLEKQWIEDIQNHKPVPNRYERRHSQLPSNRLSQLASSSRFSQTSPSLTSHFSQGTPSTPTVTKSIPTVSSRQPSQSFYSFSQGTPSTPPISSSLPTVMNKRKK